MCSLILFFHVYLNTSLMLAISIGYLLLVSFFLAQEEYWESIYQSKLWLCYQCCLGEVELVGSLVQQSGPDKNISATLIPKPLKWRMLSDLRKSQKNICLANVLNIKFIKRGLNEKQLLTHYVPKKWQGKSSTMYTYNHCPSSLESYRICSTLGKVGAQIL